MVRAGAIASAAGASWRARLGSALLLLALASCAVPAPGEGTRKRPTIVSLNPCTDAILAEVADPGQLLAISGYSQQPAATSMDLATARRFRAVSGSVEEVLALRPDLVVDGSFTSPATAAALRRLGFRLEQVPIAPGVAASEAQVRRLATLAGHPERGEALVNRIEVALAAAKPESRMAVPAIVWQSGGMVPGRDTLISELLTRAGFANAAAARGMKQADLMPLEAMLAAPPQLILAAGDAHSNEDRLLAHPALAKLKGVRRERLDPALLYCGGPTIIRAAARLAEVRASL